MARIKRDQADVMHEAYTHGYSEGLEHAQPSKITKEKLEDIKNNCAERGADLAVMKNDIANIKDTIAKVDEKLDKFIGGAEHKIDKIKEEADEKYASKKIEDAFWKVLIGVTISGLLAVASLLK